MTEIDPLTACGALLIVLALVFSIMRPPTM